MARGPGHARGRAAPVAPPEPPRPGSQRSSPPNFRPKPPEPPQNGALRTPKKALEGHAGLRREGGDPQKIKNARKETPDSFILGENLRGFGVFWPLGDAVARWRRTVKGGGFPKMAARRGIAVQDGGHACAIRGIYRRKWRRARNLPYKMAAAHAQRGRGVVSRIKWRPRMRKEDGIRFCRAW